MKTSTKIRLVVIIATVLQIFLVALNCNAQKVAIDKDGNYYSVKVKDTTTTGKLTGKVYTDPNGRKYPVYESARGSRFIMRQKKDSTYYKMYMPRQ